MAVETSQIEAVFYKDPNEKLDYRFDWGTEYLGADTISSSTWSSTPTGLTHVATSNTTTTATIRISGGIVGQTYTVTNHVVLASGQEAERSFYLKVVDR
jgi:hypothetical protein